jgi:hypothetical protein
LSDGSDISGYAVSGAMHVVLLALLVVGFSAAPKFDDATESIPVETITPSQLNEIMKGERDAKPAKAPVEPAKPAADAAIPTPPEPPPDLLKADETPPPPTRPKPAPPSPPPRPAAEAAPDSPMKPRLIVLPPERPRDPPPQPPKPPKRDDVAKAPPKETPRKPQAKTYDPNAIAKMLGQTKTADASSTITPTQGLPTQHAARMSPSIAAALDAWFKDAYLSCYSPPPTMPDGELYIAEVHVVFNSDGSLSGRPVLTNPPRDPAWRAHAESAVRAVLKCDPLRVPAQYAPYFEQWKTKTIHFDPQSALG